MRTLTLGFTPDPDDAFAFYALVHGKIPTAGWTVSFRAEPIESLNSLADEEAIDIVAISSAHYPVIAKRYAILASGASVGRGYGPALAALEGTELDDLEGAEVAIPGDTTTGAALLRLLVPSAIPVVRPFDEIRNDIAEGRFRAGVLIHEELLNYPELGLRRLLCLGAEWSRQSGLPLPVGLVVVRRGLGRELTRDVARCVRDSVLFALSRRSEASTWARRFGRGPDSPVAERFINMFANADTVEAPLDVRRALVEFTGALSRAGLTPPLEFFDWIEPQASNLAGSSLR